MARTTQTRSSRRSAEAAPTRRSKKAAAEEATPRRRRAAKEEAAPARRSRRAAEEAAPTRSRRKAAEEAAPARRSRRAAKEEAAPTRGRRKAAEKAAPARSSRRAAKEEAPTRSSRRAAKAAPTTRRSKKSAQLGAYEVRVIGRSVVKLDGELLARDENKVVFKYTSEDGSVERISTYQLPNVICVAGEVGGAGSIVVQSMIELASYSGEVTELGAGLIQVDTVEGETDVINTSNAANVAVEIYTVTDAEPAETPSKKSKKAAKKAVKAEGEVKTEAKAEPKKKSSLSRETRKGLRKESFSCFRG